jgi:hypothetical protein
MQRQSHPAVVTHLMRDDCLQLHVAHEWQRAEADAQGALAPEQAAQWIGLRREEHRSRREENTVWARQPRTRAYLVYRRKEIWKAGARRANAFGANRPSHQARPNRASKITPRMRPPHA